MKNRFGIATALLILLIAFCMGGTVFSKESAGQIKENERYTAWEQTFLESIRSRLTGQGYPNSGITMNWVKKDGRRTYTMTVHHRQISGLSEEEREQLVQVLSQEEFGDEDCGMFIVLED